MLATVRDRLMPEHERSLVEAMMMRHRDSPRIPAPIEVVSFDLWATLLRSHPRFKQQRDQCLWELLSVRRPIEEFRRIVRAVDVLVEAACAVDGRHRGLRERVELIARFCGARAPLSEAIVAQVTAVQSQLVRDSPPQLVDAALPSLLTHVSSRFVVAVTSNTGFVPAHDLKWVLEHHGLARAVSHLVFSDEVGFAKPSIRIFDHLVALAQVQRERILHIGDNSVADGMGARRAGIAFTLVGPEYPVTKAIERLLAL
ncbi:MAG: hypothetical protein QOH16_698 [Gaiellaceae bacterium]|nr:hypothetical protein [Gaiellaceae bacterium]